VTATSTAVQLRDDSEVCARIVYGGGATTVIDGKLGPICLVPPAHLVAYLVETEIATRLFLFRTRAKPEDPATAVPGVHPFVNLLLETRTRTAARRACNLLRQLPTTGHEPAELSDAFWLRLGGLLTGRLPARAASVPSLLARETRGAAAP
jgi:hypothetical protein